MNTTVSATGMELTATTPTNLLIKNNAASSTFANTAVADEAYTGKLLPASSTDAFKFNAVKDGQLFGDAGQGGAAKNEETRMMTSGVSALADAANGYYAVYNYTLRSAANASDPALSVYLKSLAIENKTPVAVKLPEATVIEEGGKVGDVQYYTDGALTTKAEAKTLAAETTYYKVGSADLTKAVRVAVVSSDYDTTLLYDDDDSTNPVGKLYGIYALSGAIAKGIDSSKTYTEPDAEHPNNDLFATADSIATTLVTASDAIAYKAANEISVDSTGIAIKLVVWVEGEDAACVNANGGCKFSITASFAVNG